MQVARNVVRKYGPKLMLVPAGVGLSLVGGLAHADSAAAVAAITSAQTDALAVAAGLVAMGVAIWGALYLYRKFFK